MLAVEAAPETYVLLDVAQLIKHAFGVARSFAGQAPILVYLYWEPTNAESHPAFELHRSEIAQFAERIADGIPSFRAMNYQELWEEWSAQAGPSWLADHLTALKQRYDVAI